MKNKIPKLGCNGNKCSNLLMGCTCSSSAVLPVPWSANLAARMEGLGVKATVSVARQWEELQGASTDHARLPSRASCRSMRERGQQEQETQQEIRKK